MRARNQDGAKQDLLKNLNENQALITCDCAMKFLPRKFREGQSDWFGKRGINWHISVTLYKHGEELKTITHVHIFSSQISQDGSVTASVLCDVVNDLTKQVPNIQEVNFFSDNAGCYKNTMMMVALKDELGDKLKTYNFSEAQDGKGPCDRRASHIKACVRRYINEGHDVTSAEEMKQAIDVKQKGSFRVRVVDIVTNLDAEKSQIKPITGITQLHNFSFDVNGITVWKAYGIGEGKRISWDNIGTTEQRTNLLVKVDWTITAPQLLEVEVIVKIIVMTAGYNLKCPARAEWKLRGNISCSAEDKYVCLFNLLDQKYMENCLGSDRSSIGSKLVFQPLFNLAECNSGRYQPIVFTTHGNSECIYSQSKCTEEGQVVFSNGSARTDNTCRCDYTKGYAFVTRPKNSCFCNPSYEDCSCFRDTCTKLSADYQCITDGEIMVNSTCQEIPPHM
ncbi:uncharacterized protein LOC143055120 [Mytilus galloprovincialis]|uniref:uncharacterized protein LOC143055120 n=1 Tax=Mytilus galloprovincialis TaxID=29158 RepID=UPI003F7CB120